MIGFLYPLTAYPAYPPILIVIRVGRERAFSICYSTVAATNWGEMTNEEQNAG